MSDPSAADATSSAECPTIMPLCSACGQTMGKRQFSQNQLTKGDRARCKSCVNSGTASTVAQSQGFVAPQAGDHTITRSATGGVTLTGDMSHEAISAFCTAAGWMEGDHASGEAKVAAGAVAQPETPRFVFRGLRANECLDGVVQPWQLAPEPPRREGLHPKAWIPSASTPSVSGLVRALEEGSAVSNEFIHSSVSPVAATFYAAAFHGMGNTARVVKIDLGVCSPASVIDVSSVVRCRARGVPPRSVAEAFAVAHEVILLSEAVPPAAIVAVYDVSWVRDLPRGERHTCSLHQYTEKIPKLLLSEIKAWAGPSRVNDLPGWHDLFALPLKHLWRAENSRQLHMYGPPAPAPLLETADFAYFPARFAEAIDDSLDERQRHWLLEHGFERQTQVWDEYEERWVQLHPNARVHINGETPIPPDLLADPSFGALHVDMAVDVQASLLINRLWHDSEGRDSHVSRKCCTEDGDEWAKQFLAGCKILEEEYSEEELLRKIRLACVSAVRSLGFRCDRDSDSSVPGAATSAAATPSEPQSLASGASCPAAPGMVDTGDMATTTLRFPVGARVECKCGTWKAGTVIKHWYTQRSFPEGTWVPYQVECDDGKKVYAPQDVDAVIRALTEPSPVDGCFKPGSRVQLSGLESAAHLNGRTAHVLQLVESASGIRHAVQLELARKGEAPSLKAKPANLQAMPALPRTAAELQKLVDAAEEGGVVSMPAGQFVGASLEIKRAITLQGQGPTATVIAFPIHVGVGASGALLHLSNFGVDGASLTVGSNRTQASSHMTGIGPTPGIKRAHLSKVHVSLGARGGDDALVINRIGQGYARDTVLVEDCEVRGGSDGVMIDTSGVRLLRCRIVGAYSRGIFANESFVIEDSTVQGCGGYGMKIRSGCDRRGRNNIQSGPWDGHMEFGGMGGMGGMFGMGSMCGGYGSDEGYDDEEEVGPCGFTQEEEMELLSQGVKPWDEDAHAVLAALNDDGGYY